MRKLADENGVITILTLVTILFIVSFLISSYVLISNKVKTQKDMLSETRKIYESPLSMEEIYNSYFNNTNMVPIYTVNQLLMIGSGQKNVNINGKYYNFDNNENTVYVLMNDLTFKASDYKDKITDGYWTPIGDKNLKAKFEGKSYEIKVIYEAKNRFYSRKNNFSDILPDYNEANKNSDGTLAQDAKYTVGAETAIIPKGFKVSDKTGENTIEEGLVIIDSKGNEFVWIPCTSSAYKSATFDSSWIEYSYKGGTWSDSQTAIGEASLKWIEENRTKLGLEENEGAGFYVARYEAGIPEDAPFYASKDGDEYKKEADKNTTAYKPVSKKGVPAWSFINQINAKIVSENMYKGKSYLVDSYAWNYICKNILQEKAGKNITNSTNWGNYYTNTTTKYEELDVLYAIHIPWTNIATKYHKGTIPIETAPKGKGNNRLELCTGASEDFKAYNIYDMAGNIWEWTTETGTSSSKKLGCAVLRGGGMNDSGVTYPIVSAFGNRESETYFEPQIGFRVVLYL